MSRQKEKPVSLSDEQREKLKSELAELYKWKNQECEKLEAELRKEGRWNSDSGLDLNQYYFSDIIDEFQKRFRIIGKKYGISPGRNPLGKEKD